MTPTLPFGFTFKDLYDAAALEKLDGIFVSFLEENVSDLSKRLIEARQAKPTPTEESALLLDIAPYVEEFIGTFFSIEKAIHALQDATFHLAPLYRCKRLFVQRQAAKAFTKEDVLSFDGLDLQHKIETFLNESYSDLAFARHVLNALENKDIAKDYLPIATQYAAWALHQDKPSLLFRLPRKTHPEALIPLKREGRTLTSPHHIQRKGFDCTDPGPTLEEALDQAHYCILCHHQKKDSCAKGYTEKAKGCPLGQKISEMNTLRTQGYVLGALAMIMVDNPMVAATGRRICNDCEKACIFQKQEAVDIPTIESQTLESIVHLPWGVEIYSLLSRWNPLNLARPFPKGPSGYKVLVAGMGPAGFTLAHYLMNEGHQVVGIDSLPITPLDNDLLTQPIQDWSSLKKPLSQRPIEGFGGVMEYGITARWDKNYLKLVRLLLERRSQFSLYDNIKLGETLPLAQAFDQGFDHVALCLGAGAPKTLVLPHGEARGVKLSADFLIELQLKGALQNLTDLQLRLPILVLGGGLTAVDAATEALAYYEFQVESFLKKMEKAGALSPSLSPEEQEVAQEFLNHAKSLRQGDRSFLQNAVTIVYRKTLQESPSYQLNDRELKLSLQEGVRFLENALPLEVHKDPYGHIKTLKIQTPHGDDFLPCRTLLIAIGTHPNSFLEEELRPEGHGPLISYKGENKLSFFGDLHPVYEGNVVKAMASAKNGYPYICEALERKSKVT